MAKPRPFRKYQGRVKGKIVHGGITERSLEDRQQELNRKYPGIKLKQVGRATTEEAARQWEKDKDYS